MTDKKEEKKAPRETQDERDVRERMEEMYVNSRGLVRVLGYLYLGDAAAAANRRALAKTGITHVINCAGDELENFHEKHFEYTTFEFEESNEPMGDYFDTAYEVILGCKTAKTKCLVHCTDGKSLAPTIIIAYILKAAAAQKKMTSLQATYKYVGTKEPGIRPEDKYLKELILLENELFDCTTMRVAPRQKRQGGRRSGKGRGGKGRRGK